MRHISIQYLQTPAGEILIGDYDGKLCLADWRYRDKRTTIDYRIQSKLGANYLEEESELLDRAEHEIDLYFQSKRQNFDLPLLLVGTQFQESIWREISNIPFGQRVSYQELANKIGKESSVRAVATAVGANAISILIPCHRVVGSDGSLRGYAGGLETKKRLLELEQTVV